MLTIGSSHPSSSSSLTTATRTTIFRRMATTSRIFRTPPITIGFSTFVIERLTSFLLYEPTNRNQNMLAAALLSITPDQQSKSRDYYLPVFLLRNAIGRVRLGGGLCRKTDKRQFSTTRPAVQ